jgi:glycine/D-amino acid oxidase-like deaminating enzyme
MEHRPDTTAILGAGLTGCCTALELARRGHPVVLIEQDAEPLRRASLRNEGKIHLGLVYANDPTLATGLLQLRSALRFHGLLERWLGARVRRIRCSTPFDYLVANDSLVEPERLREFYARLEEFAHAELAADPTLDYLGTRPPRLVEDLAPDESVRHFTPGSVRHAFRTAERAIDTDDLAREVRGAIADGPLIRVHAGHEVRGISSRGDSLVVEGVAEGRPFAIAARQVVNATWERRLALDRTFGLPTPAGVLHRLKYRVIVRPAAAMEHAPSVTMVLGRYGDVVVRPDGTVYLSWYPAGLQGWSSEIEPPRDWDAACRGEPSPEVAARVARETIAAIAAWMPAIANAAPLAVDAGSIVAHGHTDVDDRASGLHRRTQVGVHSVGPYHSVDPGKLTTAPVFALEAAERVARGFATGTFG